MNRTETVQAWDGGDLDGDTWTLHALHGTVVIESAAEEALAILVDDGGSRRFRLAPDKVPSFLGAATHAWRRVNASGSVAVIWMGGKGKGVVGPPIPPPPPGPIGEELLFASTLMGHHQLLAAGQLAIRASRR